MAIERLEVSGLAASPASGTVIVSSGPLQPGIWEVHLMISSSANNVAQLRLIDDALAQVRWNQYFWHLGNAPIIFPLRFRAGLGEKLQVLQQAGSYAGSIFATIVGFRGLETE